jgi:hypothetical protein
MYFIFFSIECYGWFESTRKEPLVRIISIIFINILPVMQNCGSSITA